MMRTEKKKKKKKKKNIFHLLLFRVRYCTIDSLFKAKKEATRTIKEKKPKENRDISARERERAQ
jgi:hypothetical protein